jgi:hypothetical protein
MSKAPKGGRVVKLVLTPLVTGILLTMLTGFYSHKTLGQYCSPDPELNARIDCSLQVNNRGLPLAYDINPDFQPKHGVQAIGLITDIVVWSGVSGTAILILRKLKA